MVVNRSVGKYYPNSKSSLFVVKYRKDFHDSNDSHSLRA